MLATISVQHVVQQDGRIRQDHALDRAVRNIALVPQRDIFEGGCGIRAHHAGQAANLLARDRIAFVRHGRAAALFAAEGLFHFAHLGALQVADFEGNALERGRQNREGGEILRVTVAFNDLRSNRCRGQAEPPANSLFDIRAQVRAGSDGAGNFAYGHLLRGGLKAREVAPVFGVPVRDFQAECDGLGVNAVRAPDLGSVFKLPGAALQNCSKLFKNF